MKDFLGNELQVGDKIVYVSHSCSSSELCKGEIVGFTSCYIKLSNGFARVSPYKVVKVAA